MGANRTRTRWTYAEFARLPSDGSTRYEVIDGELHMTPSPAVRHQRILTRLVALLHMFVRANDLGEVFGGPLDVLFGEGDYLEPDILFVRKERSELLSDRGVEGPPDLVVEVASPSTVERDRGVKLDRYRHFGVAEYWIVDPETRTIDVWGLAAGAETAEVFGLADRFTWSPGGGATLDIQVGDVLGGE